MKERIATLFLCMLLATLQVFGQEVLVTGKVTDEDSRPLSGVSVILKETSEGTRTDADGNYSIKANKGQTLLFSSIGALTQELMVGNNPVITVSLKKDAKSLQDVVVVGYGTQKKSDLTGAVSTIDVQKTLGSRPVADLARGLQGSSPGLLVTTSSGDPGQSPEIHLRGVVGSVNADATPLILLDNVPIPNMMI